MAPTSERVVLFIGTELRGTNTVDPSTLDSGTAVRLGILAVNLIIWTGLFLYLLRLGGKLRAAEQARPETEP
jgi:CcmD family protein